MMRIVQLTTVHQWNDIRIYRKIARSLASAGHEVHLVAPAPDVNIEEPDPAVQVHWIPISQNRFRRFLGSIRAIRQVLSIHPHVIHFHDPELMPWGVILRLMGFQVVYDVHEHLPDDVCQKDWIPGFLRWPISQICRFAEGLVSRIVSANCVVTRHIANRFPQRSTWIVQNCPFLDTDAAANSRHSPKGTSAFVYVGSLSESRGIREMVEAMRMNEGFECSVELAGAFQNIEFESWVRSEIENQPIHLCGWLDRTGVSDLLSRATAGFVLYHPTPNFKHGQPIKLFEYMSAGLPVIASHFDAYRAIVDGAGCGLLVDPEDPQAISDAMQWIMDHPREAEEMGHRGRIAVEDRFNWVQESRQLLDMYAALADRIRSDT